MQDQPLKSPLSIAARIFWFCIFLAPYAIVICAVVAAVVSITSFALSFIRWRSRIFASVMGLAFLIFANVAGLSAIALPIYSETK